MDTNEVIGPGQSITARSSSFRSTFSPPFFCTLRSPRLLFLLASSLFLRSLSLGGRRVAWLEIKHIHHHPQAVSVDKQQALNNVMKPSFLFATFPRCSMGELPRGPIAIHTPDETMGPRPRNRNAFIAFSSLFRSLMHSRRAISRSTRGFVPREIHPTAPPIQIDSRVLSSLSFFHPFPPPGGE